MTAAEGLSVAKVVIAGPVTSFRYPHLIQGVQPTYDMPPPSTIYGLICAVTGQPEPPEALQFGLHFTYEGRFRDLEHVHLSVPYGQANPFQRELLFNPRLTLYLAPDHYAEAFRKPFYPLALGRSQDLMTCLSVETVILQPATQAYFEHTLIPADYAPRFKRTVAVTMARFIDADRWPVWDHYAILRERILYPDQNDPYRHRYQPIWVDPTAPTYQDRGRGIVLHRFV